MLTSGTASTGRWEGEIPDGYRSSSVPKVSFAPGSSPEEPGLERLGPPASVHLGARELTQAEHTARGFSCVREVLQNGPVASAVSLFDRRGRFFVPTWAQGGAARR